MREKSATIMRDALADMLGILEYKVRNGVMSSDDVRTIITTLESGGGIHATVSDLAGYYHKSEADVVDGVLVYIPHKTVTTHPQTLRIPLTPTAQEIVGRYADLPGPKLLPFISPQKYNDAIKRIFLAARVRRMVAVLDPLTRKEVKKPLNEVASSHLARRAFVGNLYRKVKDRDSVSSMSGHGNKSAAFDRYRDIDDDFKTEIVNLLEE